MAELGRLSAALSALAEVGATFIVSTPAVEVSCVLAGCPGCNGMHRTHTGKTFVSFRTATHEYTAEVVPGTGKWEAING